MNEEEFKRDGPSAQEQDSGDAKDAQVEARNNGLEESHQEEDAAEKAAEERPLGAPAISIESQAEVNQAPALPHTVVGFGASAGGIQAFKEVLENLDSNTGMSFVLVTHLAPDQKSFLSEIVERYTHMPVSSIEDGQRPEPNHLYVLLPNQSLTLRDGHFHVEPPGANE